MGGRETALVRHGETEWSRTMRHTGRTDVQLTDAGREQARELGGRLAGREFGRVLVSPLARARETCELAGLGTRAEVRDELVEFDYGEAEGLTTPEMRERIPDWTVWTHGSPGGESPEDVGERLRPLLAELRAAEEDVAIFAHGHVLRVLTALWIDLPAASGAHFALRTAALSALGWERETPAIRLWNS